MVNHSLTFMIGKSILFIKVIVRIHKLFRIFGWLFHLFLRKIWVNFCNSVLVAVEYLSEVLGSLIILKFSALESNRGNISKFCITKIEWNKSSKNYIRAHTCFNRLDMPEYPNYKLVQEAVNFIIQNEILGFGVD